MKWILVIAMCLMCSMAYATDVKVDKISDTQVSVRVTPATRVIQDTADINQISEQLKKMQTDLTQLNDVNFVNAQRQKHIEVFDKQVENQKLTLQENINVYTEIISKADALGVKVKAEAEKAE